MGRGHDHVCLTASTGPPNVTSARSIMSQAQRSQNGSYRPVKGCLTSISGVRTGVSQVAQRTAQRTVNGRPCAVKLDTRLNPERGPRASWGACLGAWTLAPN